MTSASLSRVVAAAALLLAGIETACAAEPRVLAGPIPATVVRVIDGDTLEVRAQIWIGQEVLVRVRLAGVDAPELGASCAEERAAARQARDLLAHELLTEDARVHLTNVRGGKYFGAVIANVRRPGGEDVSRLLLEARLAIPYDGRGRVTACCGPSLCQGR